MRISVELFIILKTGCKETRFERYSIQISGLINWIPLMFYNICDRHNFGNSYTYIQFSFHLCNFMWWNRPHCLKSLKLRAPSTIDNSMFAWFFTKCIKDWLKFQQFPVLGDRNTIFLLCLPGLFHGIFVGGAIRNVASSRIWM